jgi:hypothetical protein
MRGRSVGSDQRDCCRRVLPCTLDQQCDPDDLSCMERLAYQACFDVANGGEVAKTVNQMTVKMLQAGVHASTGAQPIARPSHMGARIQTKEVPAARTWGNAGGVWNGNGSKIAAANAAVPGSAGFAACKKDKDGNTLRPPPPPARRAPSEDHPKGGGGGKGSDLPSSSTKGGEKGRNKVGFAKDGRPHNAPEADKGIASFRNQPSDPADKSRFNVFGGGKQEPDSEPGDQEPAKELSEPGEQEPAAARSDRPTDGEAALTVGGSVGPAARSDRPTDGEAALTVGGSVGPAKRTFGRGSLA